MRVLLTSPFISDSNHDLTVVTIARPPFGPHHANARTTGLQNADRNDSAVGRSAGSIISNRVHGVGHPPTGKIAQPESFFRDDL